MPRETVRSVRSDFDLSRIAPLLSGRVIGRPTELALEILAPSAQVSCSQVAALRFGRRTSRQRQAGTKFWLL